MFDLETQWITHPDYPGWRKRRLVSPDGQRMAAVYHPWERIPGSDPSLPPPPEPGLRTLPNNRPMPPNSISPPWGRPNLIPRRNLPNIPNLPNTPPRMYNMPEAPINDGRRFNMPSPYPKKTLENMVPLGGGGGGINPPWANMRKPVVDMTRDITIPPARRRNIRGTVDPNTGQNRLIQGGPIYPDQSDNFKKFHEIQEAYFSGADFGYEEGWPERLGVSERMINMFMSTPEEAIIFAFENPTDAVLEEFERKYGWPLNVNSPALREYVMQMKRQNGV